MEFTDDSFTTYQCTNMNCKMKYTDRDLRSKISQDERIRLFENVSNNAIEMTESVKDVDVDARLLDIDVDPDLPDPVQVNFSVNQQFGYPVLKE